MNVPADRKYSKTHEWFKFDGDIITVGITQHAADTLTDITYVELQPVGTQVKPNDSVGEIESVKATSEIFVVMAGEIVEINPNFDDHPESINDDAFDEGWLVKIKVEAGHTIDPASLISDVEYLEMIKAQ